LFKWLGAVRVFDWSFYETTRGGAAPDLDTVLGDDDGRLGRGPDG
jgi:hypothetical protein